MGKIQGSNKPRDFNGCFVPDQWITVTGLLAGDTVRIYDEHDKVELFCAKAKRGKVAIPVSFECDREINVRVRNRKILPFEAKITCQPGKPTTLQTVRVQDPILNP